MKIKMKIANQVLLLSSLLLTSCSNSSNPNSNPIINEPLANTASNPVINEPLASSTQAARIPSKYGYFLGNVKAEWLDSNREMKLLSNLKYIDPNGEEWLASKGSKVDGASIPQMLWSMIGSPFSGKYRKASVIHDVACEEKKRPWKIVHKTFYNAMRASGVGSLQSSIMYAAVNNFGPRWGEVRGETDTRLSDANFNKLIASIKQAEASGKPMTTEQIQNFK